MADLQFPLQFKRQYAAPIDIDMVFANTAAKNSYLTNARRYAGQIVTCLEEPGKIFILNNDRNAWIEFSGGGVSSGIQGRFQLNSTDITYTVSHPSINPSTEYPVATLEVSGSASDLHILGIHDRTSTSFKFTISGLADANTYLLWHISSQSAIPFTTISSSGGSIEVNLDGSNYNIEVVGLPSGEWGTITGDISAQTDLQEEFVNATGDTMTGTLTMSGAGVRFITDPIPDHQEGLVFYDPQTRSLSYYNDQPDVMINLGQEHVVRVSNQTGSTIINGQVVCISGSQGSKPLIVLADNLNPGLSHQTLGVATHNIDDNAPNGYVTTQGLVNGLNTLAFSAEGIPLWLGTAGNIVETEPSFPAHKVRIGYLVRKHETQGSILVHIETGLDLKDVHDVSVSSISIGDILAHDGTKWTNDHNILDYSLKTEVSGISADLQTQINQKVDSASFDESVDDRVQALLVAGNNIAISYDDTFNELTISANISGSSSLLQGTVTCDVSASTYTISHPPIDLNYSFPVVSLIVPNNGSNLFVQGITNRTQTSFDVTLSEVPNISGYYITWHLPTTNTSLDGVPVINLALSNIPSYTTSVSGSYEISLSETVVYADKENIIVLPGSPTSNESHWIVNTYSSDILIHGNGKDIRIDGIDNPTLTLTPDSSLHIHFNAFKNKWYVI